MKLPFKAFFLAVALLLPCYGGGQSPDSAPPAQRAAHTAIGFRAERSIGEQLTHSAAVFALLAVALVSSAYAYRYVQRQRLVGSGRRLKVVETLPLSPKTRLFLVEVDQRVILLSQHGATLSVLADHARVQEGGDHLLCPEVSLASRE